MSNLGVRLTCEQHSITHYVAAEHALGDQGRVLVRYSGTQTMLRVTVEGPDATIEDRLATEIADAVRRARS